MLKVLKVDPPLRFLIAAGGGVRNFPGEVQPPNPPSNTALNRPSQKTVYESIISQQQTIHTDTISYPDVTARYP